MVREPQVNPSSPLTELPEFSVGDHEGPKRLQVLAELVGILFRIVLVDRNIGLRGVTGGEVLSPPDELLDQFPIVLAEHHLLGLLNDIADVLDESLTLFGEILGRRREGLGGEGGVHGDIALFVLSGLFSTRL